MTTRSHSDQPPVSSDPWWMLLCALFVIALCLLALPAIIIGFLMQRVMTRLLSCLWSFGIWVILLIPCVYLLTQWYQHGLQAAMIHEVIGYFLAAKQYQYDLARWPWKRLLAQTWLLWIETLVGIPIAGFWFEQVRSFGGSLVIAAQGYAALGLPEYAHRILDSCSTYILHACSDPMPIIEKLAKRSDWTPRGPRTRKV